MTHLDEFTLQEYADDALDAEQQQRVSTHLTICAECRAEVASFQQLNAVFAALADEPLTVDLSSRVLDQLQAEQTQPKDVWQRWGNPILLAQLILFVVMVVILWPTIESTLQTANQLLFSNLSGWQMPQLLVWGELVEWITAVYSRAQSLQPTFNLPPTQLYAVFVLALILWLIGNRLIFSETTSDQRDLDKNKHG